MSNIKPESLVWLDNLAAITAQLEKTPDATHAELGEATHIDRGTVTVLLGIKPCFDPAAIEKVRQAAQGTPPYILSFNSAKALVRLKKKKVSDLHDSIHAALDIALSAHLDTRHIKTLVEWMAGGKPASEFDPKVKLKPAKVETTGHPDPEADGNEEPPSVSPQMRSGISAPSHKIKSVSPGPQKPKQNAKPDTEPMPEIENLFLDWLADISIISQIKSKIKKRKRVTKGEVVLLWLHKTGELLGHGVKIVLKMFKPFFKIIHWILKILIDCLKEVGLYKYAKTLFVFAAFFIACWFIWEAFHYGVMRPVEMIWSKIHVNSHSELTQSSPLSQLEASTQMPTPQPAVSTFMSLANSAMVHLKPKPTAIPTPLMVYQPASSFKTTDYDPKLLEIEIAAIPPGSRVKDFPLAPDETMPGDLAASRLQDLTNADKYTMKIGHGTQKILLVNPTTTNLTINYKSADAIGSFLGGPGQMNFFWEDVTAIHSNEVDVSSKTGIQPIFQCSLIVSGAKNPLTVQCSTPSDLNHIISSFEYWIRLSRAAHDAPLEGMPYPSQGLRLNDKNLVEVLWANSPADKAGMKLGDMIWSLEKNTQEQQNRKNLETSLQALTPGPHQLFFVLPSDRDKGLAQMNADHTNFFNPQRHKVLLTIF